MAITALTTATLHTVAIMATTRIMVIVLTDIILHTDMVILTTVIVEASLIKEVAAMMPLETLSSKELETRQERATHKVSETRQLIQILLHKEKEQLQRSQGSEILTLLHQDSQHHDKRHLIMSQDSEQMAVAVMMAVDSVPEASAAVLLQAHQALLVHQADLEDNF